jgi:hypothetical protein
MSRSIAHRLRRVKVKILIRAKIALATTLRSGGDDNFVAKW